MPRVRRAQRRMGVTLLELVVVLVVMSLAATIAVPEFRHGMMGNDDAVPPELAILTDARRLATLRGEPLRLKVAHDGVWTIVAVRDGVALRGGRAARALTWQPDVTIDAMGGCVLAAGVVPPNEAESWDPLGCRWRMRTRGSP